MDSFEGLYPNPKTGRLRSRPRPSAKVQLVVESQALGSPENVRSFPAAELRNSQTPNVGRSSKRQRLKEDVSDDSTIAVGSLNVPRGTSLEEDASLLPKALSPSIEKTPSRKKKRPRTSSTTTRASAFNLHNYPSDHHPVGIAIWILQKIDQARRGRSESHFSSSHSEASPEPSSKHSSPTQINASGLGGNLKGQETLFDIQYPKSSGYSALAAANHALEQENLVQNEESLTRLRAQRDRKSKQRLENWAKNKENDVVARAKLEAKKKYGLQQVNDPVTEVEKQEYIKKRAKDDYGRLLRRQTAGFANDIAQMTAFRPEFSEQLFGRDLQAVSDTNILTAGKLLTGVLSSLAEIQVSAASQYSAVALVSALESRQPPTDSFFAAIRILASDESVLLGIDRVLRQLFGQKLTTATAPEMRSIALALTSSSTLPSVSDRQQDLERSPSLPGNKPIQPPSHSVVGQKNEMGTSSPMVDTTRSQPVIINPGQARSSGRERKPTAKVLATGRDTLFRRSLPPDKTYSNIITNQVVSTPKIPSKLKISHSILQLKDTAPNDTFNIIRPKTSVGFPHPSPKSADNSGDTSKQGGAEIASKYISTRNQNNNSLGAQTISENTPSLANSASFPYTADPQLIKNLLYMAEQAASMSDSDEDDEGSETSHPSHETHDRLSTTLSKNRNEPQIVSVEADPRGYISKEFTEEHVVKLHQKSMNGEEHNDVAPQESPEPHKAILQANSTTPSNNAHAVYTRQKSLAKGTPLLVAQEAGLTYPEIPRPYTDRDGWTMTGRINEHGDEVVKMDPRTWTVLNVPSCSKPMPSLRRIKSSAQVAEDLVFGYPPRIGGHTKQNERKRKSPEEDPREENVAYEIAMYRIREAARERGLGFNRIMTWEQLHAAIKQHDTRPPGIPSTIPVHDQVFNNVSVTTSNSQLLPAPSDFETRSVTHQFNDEAGLGSSTAHVSKAPNVEPESQRISRKIANTVVPSPATLSKLTHATGSEKCSRGGEALHSPPPCRQLPSNDSIKSFSTDNRATPPLPPPAKRLRLLPPKRASSSSSPSPRLPSPLNAANALNGGFPGGGIIINAQEKMDAKLRAKSKGPDFKMNLKGARRSTPILQAQPVRGGQIIKFEIL